MAAQVLRQYIVKIVRIPAHTVAAAMHSLRTRAAVAAPGNARIPLQTDHQDRAA